MPDERYKSDVGQVLAAVFILGYPRDPNQFLNFGITSHRDHKPAAGLELLFQRLRDLRPASCDNDAIIGGVLRPALGSVAVEHVHVVVAQVGER